MSNANPDVRIAAFFYRCPLFAVLNFLMIPPMFDLVPFTLVTFSAIFFVVDPFAVIPMFLSMTRGDSAAKRRAMALKAALAVRCKRPFSAKFRPRIGSARWRGSILLGTHRSTDRTPTIVAKP